GGRPAWARRGAGRPGGGGGGGASGAPGGPRPRGGGGARPGGGGRGPWGGGAGGGWAPGAFRPVAFPYAVPPLGPLLPRARRPVQPHPAPGDTGPGVRSFQLEDRGPASAQRAPPDTTGTETAGGTRQLQRLDSAASASVVRDEHTPERPLRTYPESPASLGLA